MEVTLGDPPNRVAVRIPDRWRPFELPGCLGAWIDEPGPTGFAANVNIVRSAGSSTRGDDLAEEVLGPVLGQLEDPLLVDASFEGDDDLRAVIAYRAAEHRVTLLQRILVRDEVAMTVSVTVSDLQVDALRDIWEVPLQTLRWSEDGATS
jgi:hypothetical protein